jgi:hypothetical protein
MQIPDEYFIGNLRRKITPSGGFSSQRPSAGHFALNGGDQPSQGINRIVNQSLLSHA